MRSAALTMTGSNQQLSTLLGGDACGSVILNNPVGNAIVFWGAAEAVVMTIPADTTVAVPVTSLKNIYVRGTNAEILNIAILG